MKTKYIIILSIIILQLVAAQDKNTLPSPFSMQKAPDLSYEELINLKFFELLQYNEGFLYSHDLKSGDFFIEDKANYITIYFGNKSKDKINQNNKIIFKKETFEVNGVSFKSLKMIDDEKYIDLNESKAALLSSSDYDSPGFPLVNYLWKNKMLIDKEICNFGGSNNYGKILNKSLTTNYLITSNNQQCQLFADVTDGAVITFPWSSGVATKVFCTDKIWNRIVWFDENMQNPYARTYGSSGNGYAQFEHPTGLTINGPYEYDNSYGHNWDYPIYVADYGNNRIIKYIYNVNSPSPNIWGWRIEPGSFTTVKYCTHPLEVEVHKGQNGGNDLNAQNDDIIWYTQDHQPGGSLVSTDIYGNVLNLVDFFTYQGQTYDLNPTRISVYRSPDGSQNILGCLDISLNSVIFFKLNTYGRLPSNTPLASSVWKFYSWDVPTSIKLLSSNPSLGLFAYVTHVYPSGNNKGHLNLFKVNLVNGWPIVEYISSTSYPFNTNSELRNTKNVGTQNGFVDVFCIENWDNNYGFRRYKQGLDIISESNTDYCDNGSGVTITYRLTNPANIITGIPYYSPDNGTTWTQTEFLTVNGRIFTGGNYFLPSGTNNLRFVIRIPGGANSPVPIKRVKFTLWIAPQDEIPASQAPNKFTRNYEIPFSSCSSGGGCPYLYVFTDDSLYQDNNILHKSEFSDFIGQDIADKYKLNIPPEFIFKDNTCMLQFKELNNDYSYFDKVELRAVDHPVGTELAITENQDMVLYFPNAVINPDYAAINDSDVTCSLQYDSTCTSVPGDSSDGLITTGDGDKTRILYNKVMQTIRFTLNTILKIKSHSDNSTYDFGPGGGWNELVDSLAVIFDPQADRIGIPTPVKDWAGQLTAYDVDEAYSSGNKLFSRRENRSLTCVPVGKNIGIDSTYAEWYRNYEITFFCSTPIFYGGYLERQMNLISAEHSEYGNVTPLLSAVDQNYSEMNNESTISMFFQKPVEEIPEGWTRDYVLITNGRYVSLYDVFLDANNNLNPNIPKIFKLYQNFPNPFNPKATIKFDLPKDEQVLIKIYDILGREVKTLVNEFKKAGYHQVEFDGSSYASGVYFYRIEAGTFVYSKKMILVK